MNFFRLLPELPFVGAKISANLEQAVQQKSTIEAPRAQILLSAANVLDISADEFEHLCASGFLPDVSSPDFTAAVARLALWCKNRTPGPLQVLVVDDDPAYLKTWERTLSALGSVVNFRLATNGFEGLIAIGEHQPDLLVIDLNMPGIDGFQMLATLQRRVQIPAIRIIIVTAAPETLNNQTLVDVPVIAKPLNIKATRALVAALVHATKAGVQI